MQCWECQIQTFTNFHVRWGEMLGGNHHKLELHMNTRVLEVARSVANTVF